MTRRKKKKTSAILERGVAVPLLEVVGPLEVAGLQIQQLELHPDLDSSSLPD